MIETAPDGQAAVSPERPGARSVVAVGAVAVAVSVPVAVVVMRRGVTVSMRNPRAGVPLIADVIARLPHVTGIRSRPVVRRIRVRIGIRSGSHRDTRSNDNRRDRHTDADVH
jgi:hypothetical protein